MNGIGDGPKIWSDNSSPSGTSDKEAAWKDLSSSMNALSFGFIATAILVSMFLVMAIFEHLLRSRASQPPSQTDAHQQLQMHQEQGQMHPKMVKNSQNVATSDTVDLSVLMPGQLYPTYLAHPAPLPCPREGISWPSHDNNNHYYYNNNNNNNADAFASP